MTVQAPLVFPNPVSKLHFAGERYVSGMIGSIQHEHYHRYLFAADFCRGRRVLDVACGEGYGCHLLSQVADDIVGIDIDAATISYAEKTYGTSRLAFLVADATQIPLEDASVDVVTSFETIEHFQDHERFLSEIARVLRPGGVFIVSSPNRPIYTEQNNHKNPFHVRELDREQLRSALSAHFPHSVLLEQRPICGSVLIGEDRPITLAGYESSDGLAYTQFEGVPSVHYFVAIASTAPLSNIQSSLFCNDHFVRQLEESIHSQRNEELTALQAGVAAAEHHVACLEASLSERTSQLSDVSARLTDAGRALVALERLVADRDRELGLLKSSLSWRFTSPLRRLRASSWGAWLFAALRTPVSLRKTRLDPILEAPPEVSDTIERLPADVSAPARSLVSPSLPSVSAIVPNYNHGRFLRERLASILEQRLPVCEIIILDDASTDDSREIIESIADSITLPVKTVFNDRNAGSVFSQWAKGISLAAGDLLWICESDDTCDRGFLETLVPYFTDQSVMLAFGRIDFIEEDGQLRDGMEDYLESARPGYWQTPRVESAHTWFQGPFGVRNVIPNVGGCLFRRQIIDSELLAEVASYKVCGDWHLYCRLARGGRIAYDPEARAYFRQHRANTSVANFKAESFYEEHIRIARALRRHYGVRRETLRKMLGNVREHYRTTFGYAAARNFAKRYPLGDILAQERTVSHVLIMMHGFQTGGGEIFPIHLANEISRRDCNVSVLIGESEVVNERVRRLLAPEIPVYTKAFVEKIGVQRFLDEFGVDLIHTHNVGIDMWLHARCEAMRTPYIVTHHGSYECATVSKELTTWLLAKVNHWIYISDKNLAFADGCPCDEGLFTKLPNAMPRAAGTFPFSRRDLGIEADAFVFGLASRAIPSKGWDIAIRALQVLRMGTTRPVHLILCGDGEALDALNMEHGDQPGVHFLGYQDEIQGFYRLCDCCVLPTRFAGESYPLTILEALLAGIPAIATDVGEIRSILAIDRQPMGIIVPFSDDDAVFCESVAQAMRRSLDDRVYQDLRASVMQNREMFSMDKLVDDYMAIYRRVLARQDNANRVRHQSVQTTRAAGRFAARISPSQPGAATLKTADQT